MDRIPDRSRCVVLRRFVLAVSFALASLLISADGFSSGSGPLAGSAGAAPVGSGDGRIHVIPTISRPSLRNGEKLAIGAVVTAAAGVASVEAEILPLADGDSRSTLPPLARLKLTSASPSAPTLDGPEKAGLWQGEWIGAGLAEGFYQVRLAATDKSGHVFVDRSLRFSDPIAGINAPGTNAYPDGGLRRVENGLDGLFLSAVFDPTDNCAYLGTDSVPGAVVKVALGSGATPPRRIGEITLGPGEDKLYGALIDTVHRYAYFISFSGISIIKIALKPGDALPVRVGAAAVPPQAPYLPRLACAAIDPDAGFAYLGVSDTNAFFAALPGRVFKVALGAGDASPSLVSSVSLGEAENSLIAAAIDPAARYAYFSARGGSGHPQASYCVKVALGDGDTSPVRVGALALGQYEDQIACAIDPASQFLYLSAGSLSHPGTTAIWKIALGAGDALPARVGMVDAPFANGSAAIDPASHEALFGATTGAIYKIDLGAGSAPPTIVGTIDPGTDNSPLDCVAWNTTTRRALFGSFTGPGRLINVDAGAAGASPSLLGSQMLASLDGPVNSSFVDPARGYAYFVMEGGDNYFDVLDKPPSLVKVALASGASSFRWVGEVPLPLQNIGKGGSSMAASLVAPAAGYAYLAGNSAQILARPASRILKIKLGDGDDLPQVVSSAPLAADETEIDSGVLDTSAGYGYFTVFINAGSRKRVVKVALGSGDTSPTRIGSCDLAQDEFGLLQAMIDPAGKYAYFARGRRLVKIALGDGDTSPARIGAIGFSPLYGPDEMGGTIDPASGYLWLATGSASTGRAAVHKVALGAGAAVPREVSLLPLDDADFGGGTSLNQTSSLLDKEGGFAILGGSVKIALGDGDASPTLLGRIDPSSYPGYFSHVQTSFDAASGFGYTTAAPVSSAAGHYNTGIARTMRFGYSQKGYIKSTRFSLPERAVIQSFSFYSHRPVGNFRLALYREVSASLRTRVWESNSTTNTATNGFIQISVFAGNPSTLKLDPGTYHLAWQIDTTADVPSLTIGAPGDGFFVLQDYGPFPAQMKADDATTSWTSTNERWTGFIAYQSVSGVPRELWAGY